MTVGISDSHSGKRCTPRARKRRKESSGKTFPLNRIAEELSTEYGVSPDTIKRDGKYAEASATLPATASPANWNERGARGQSISPPAGNLSARGGMRRSVHNRRKRPQGGTGANQHNVQTYQNDTSAATAATLAKEYGVPERTAVVRGGRCVCRVRPWRSSTIYSLSGRRRKGCV